MFIKTPGWLPPARKTLYIQASDGITHAQAASLAEQAAVKLANVGNTEVLSCIFRPDIEPGDKIYIATNPGDEAEYLGIATNVNHVMGESGFSTEITVDSGGVTGVQKINEYITALAEKINRVKATIK